MHDFSSEEGIPEANRVRKRVAIFTGSDIRSYGGAEREVIRIVKKLRNDIDIKVFSVFDKNNKNLRVDERFIQQQLDQSSLVWYKGKKIRLLKDIVPFQLLDVSGYDKVYSMCQGFILNSMLLRKAKKFLLGIHAQSTLDKKPIEMKKFWKRFFYRFYFIINFHYIMKANEIRIQNSDDARMLRDLNFRGRVWNVPPTMFDTSPEPEITGDFYVIWVNRVTKEKRPEEVVKVAKLCPEIEFHCIGSGPLMHLFDGIKNIKSKGFISDDDLEKEYRRASAYISTSMGENFGMSAVEAMAHGVPTIVYNVMGLRDFNKFIVKDAEEAAKAIKKLRNEFDDRGMWKKYREEIRRETLNKFSDMVTIPLIREMLES